ncbi:ABC transporter permease [Mesorhizobium sp.]|uniref:ABC transporter permease n=1 Tax=Mesorhizobium sp. TaxID=1871066 RepID=UPI000FE949BC|nr:ABC transporter permease [Mesorhizobium sp.]RWM22737.1 MAG: ABC transporter permease [Mesorhizobium sp.]RWM33072.1 MAG: ABC transporter permease [Mesorhizobium sp.]TIO73490.1 MAG: ABC transporter permease [Mesorhizobium sp.]TIO81472.1 MAG: ABC transporter permease [Mesorhizobium sp.]TJV48238.1 MAG: ABC transporter permease [Mesorhizobium sp.]
MRIANIYELGVKELRGLVRDPMMLVLIVYAFTVAIYTESKAMPETLNRAAIAIVDEDQSPVSSRIVTAFYPPYFTAPRLISQPEMDSRMDSGMDTFALDIPPNFQRDLLAGRAPTVQLNVDATRMSQAFTGGGYVQSIVSGEVNEFLNHYRSQTSLPVELDLRARFNPELNKGWFGAITDAISSITMLSIVLTGAALIREREHGTIEHLLVMPVTPFEIMTSKIWSMGIVVLVASGLALVFVIQGLLSVPINGSVALFMVGAALDIFAMTCLGIFLATVAGSMPQFGLLLMMVLLPLQVLSGGVTPRESMPLAIQAIMSVAPNTHFVMLAQAVLFRGAGLDVVWPQLAALLVIGMLLFAFSLRRFRQFLK